MDNRKEVAYFMRRLYKKGLTTTSGGNVSCRTDDGRIFITPSQTDKGRIRKNEIAEITIDGELLTNDLKVSMETGMHLAIYKLRPDVKAIVHAHPVFASTYAAAGLLPLCNLLGESRAILGNVKLVKYELMGTPKLAKAVSESLQDSNVSIMLNHGAIAVGNNLLQAFDRLEVLEAASKVSFNTGILAKRKELTDEEILEIDKLMGR